MYENYRAMQLRDYVNKKFIESDEGAFIIDIIQQEGVGILERCQEIMSILELPGRVEKSLLVEAKDVAEKQMAAFNVLDQRLSNTIKEVGNPQLKDQLLKVRLVVARYSKLVNFLNEVLTGLNGLSLVDSERVARFQKFYQELLSEQQEIQNWLEEFYQLNPIDNTGEYHKQLDVLPRNHNRLIQLQERHIPRVVALLDKIESAEFQEYVPSRLYTVLEKYGINFVTAEKDSFYIKGVGFPKTGTSDTIHIAQEKSKDDIISCLLELMQASGLDMQKLEVVAASESPTLYIYSAEANVTIVISNVYGYGTHIYPCRVPLSEIETSSIDELKTKYNASHLYFNDVTGLEGWQKRLNHKLGSIAQQRKAPEKTPMHKPVARPVVVDDSSHQEFDFAQMTVDEKVRAFHTSNLSRGVRTRLHDEIKKDYLQEFDRDELDVERGDVLEGYVMSYDHGKIYIVLGGTTDQHVIGHIMKRDYRGFYPQKFQRCKVRVRRIYPSTGHIELDLEDQSTLGDILKQQLSDRKYGSR